MKIYLSTVFLFTLVLSTSINLNAQSFESDYTLLKCQAPIPRSILTTAAYKSDKNVEEHIDKSERRRSREKKKTFIIQSNYLIDQLLKSDLLLFNTPLNKLIEDIAAHLLKDNPEDLKTLNFYIVKSESVNAFATDRGDIFVTMGLLARLESEAELAFIISHEIIHFQEKHSLDAFVEYEEIEGGRSSFKNLSNVLLQKSNYSKSLEIEADEKGMKLYAKSGFDLDAVFSTFEILRFAHTAVFNTPIEPADIELAHIKIDTANWMDTPPPLKPLKDFDKYKTHPDIDKRIEILNDLRVDYTKNDRSLFINRTREEFKNLVLMAQFELVQVLLHERNYTNALYHTKSLLKQFPDNAFLQKSYAYAFYGLGQYALMDELGQITDPQKSVQGEWRKVHHLFKNMPKKKVGVLAAAHCWETAQKFPEDEKIKLMAKDIIEDIVIFKIENPIEYFLTPPIDSSYLEDEVPSLRIAFASYLPNAVLEDYLKDGEKYRKKRNERIAFSDTREGEDEQKEEARDKLIKGVSIGAKKIVVVNPIYLEGKATFQGVEMDFINSETLQKDLKEQVTTIGKSLKLPVKVLDYNQLRKNAAIEEFNDIQVIQSWTEEFFNHPDYMVSTFHENALDVCDKYESDHFSSLGVISFQNRKNNSVLLNYLIATRGVGLIPYFIPATMPGALFVTFRKKNEMYYFMNTVNMRTYRLELDDFNKMNLKTSEEVIKSNLYWSMNQIKRKK